MHSIFALGLILSFGVAKAYVDNCLAHPEVDSLLAKCRTVTPFCESVLGRGPLTMTETFKKYTTTIVMTQTNVEVSTRTFRSHTTLPTLTLYQTVCDAATTTPAAVAKGGLGAATAATAAPDVTSSCGVGVYSSNPQWISTACSCQIDSTVILASKTVVKTSGVSISLQTTTASTSITLTSYLTTKHATSTLFSDNCYPPANASCLMAETCETYKAYECGSNNITECYCGYDSHGDATCFQTGECEDACVYDYDCAFGSFCLYDSCCQGNFCAVADVCVGDQPTTTSGSVTATVSAKAVGRLKGSGNMVG